MRKPLDCPYEGPHEIIERVTDRVFKVKIKGEPTTISTERLKPTYQETLSFEDIQDTSIDSQPLKTYPPATKRRVTFAI